MVTIITITYKHSRFISKCIESVKDQTYKDWEMIILDDESNDDTFKLAKKYSNNDSRIKVFRQKNIGLENLKESYNFALKKASKNSKYIAVLEGDDFWGPQKLKTYVRVMERDNSVLSYGISYTVNEFNEVIDYYPKKAINKIGKQILENNPVGVFLQIYLFKSFIPSPTIMLRKDILESIGGFCQPNILKVVDYPTILEFCKYGYFSFVNEPHSYYRIFAEQATAGDKIGANTAGIYALHFYKNLNYKIKSIININKDNLTKNIKLREHLNYFHRGRILLIGKKYNLAFLAFKKLCRSDFFKIRLRGYLGCLAALLKFNIEFLISLLGGRKLK